MATEAQLKAGRKYDKANTRQVHLKLNRRTDSDVLERLDSVPFPVYMCYMLREYIFEGKPSAYFEERKADIDNAEKWPSHGCDRALSISRETIRKLLDGSTTRPTALLMMQLARLFECGVEDLMREA